MSDCLKLIAIVLLAMLVIALSSFAFYYMIHTSAERNSDRGVYQVIIINGTSFRDVQSATNKWLAENEDVNVVSITMDYCENDTFVGAYYFSTIVYRSK